MAQVKIQALIDELVDSIITHDSVRGDVGSVINSYKETALRNLRYHRFSRTNQFNVRKSLDGLVEKFQLLNNDPLADALDSRVKRLNLVQSKWTPEILALLLFLSDNPAAKASVQHLEKLKPEPPPPPLTWKDIVADDPSYDDRLWHPSYSPSESSDGEATNNTAQNKVISDFASDKQTNQLSQGEDVSLRVKELVVGIDTSILDDLAGSKAPQTADFSGTKTCITELQAIREVLHMLHGLPSSLFESNKTTGGFTPVRIYSIDKISQSTLLDILTRFSEIGSDLAVLRRNVHLRFAHPLLHSFASAVDRCVREIDEVLASIETVFVQSHGRAVVSLLNTLDKVNSHTRHLAPLKNVVFCAGQLDKGNLYRLLDHLYDHACNVQATGDDATFGILASIFLDCLNVFLRPIRRWMVQGELEAGIELISDSAAGTNVDPAMFWEHRFTLLHRDGAPAAPCFLLSLISLVFTSGKSVAFLNELGVEINPAARLTGSDSPLTVDLTRETDDATGLLPFSVLLDVQLRNWVRSKHQLTSRALCEQLLHRFGVLRIVNALEHLYLSRDGAVFESFADRVFSRLDTGMKTWNDKHIVENIAQQVFGAVDCIDTDSISTAMITSKRESHTRVAMTVSSFTLNYSFSWPVQNIIPIASLSTYQQTFAFLIQTYRAHSLLSRRRFRSYFLPRGVTSSNHTPSAAADSNVHLQAQSLAQHLHHRLLHLTSTLQGYTTQTAIDLSCLALHKALAAAHDVDEMLAAHALFINNLQRRCLLAKEVENTRNALTRLLELVYAFADLFSALHGDKSLAGGDARGSPAISGLDRDSDDEDVEGPASDGQRENNAANVSDTRAQRPLDLQSDALVARLGQMKSQYVHLLSIAIAGLRDARREEGGEEAWEELAERLEWSMGR